MHKIINILTNKQVQCMKDLKEMICGFFIQRDYSYPKLSKYVVIFFSRWFIFLI